MKAWIVLVRDVWRRRVARAALERVFLQTRLFAAVHWACGLRLLPPASQPSRNAGQSKIDGGGGGAPAGEARPYSRFARLP